MSLSPPVSQGIYHYHNGDFLVTSSKQNCHRRASLQELQALLHPTLGQVATKDHPGHWYRAQLLHYGLPPSDNKGTAAKRLLDAFNQGKLIVPAHLQLLEKELKKEWDSNERKAKKERTNAAKTKKPAKGMKRTAEDDLVSAVTSAAMTGISAANVTNANVSINVNIGGSATKATTKFAQIGSANSQYDRRNTQFTGVWNYPRPLQTARASKAYREATEPRSTALLNTTDEKPKQTAKKSSPKLGLINGKYSVQVYVPGLDMSSSSITLCLDSPNVWGDFQIGHLTGVFFMTERPYRVFDIRSDNSHDACTFEWRATDRSRGNIPILGPNCTGAMKFLGNGTIEGWFNCLLADANGEVFDCDFRAQRLPGQGTKVPRTMLSMREEFEELRKIEATSYPDEPPPPYFSDEEGGEDMGWMLD
ncbi:hypothetical protein BDV59DRAFT_205896 [Aspergillus ambiguus]|uniref:uncharacterized protein n=1 Tax=Aspergillus ambiguus TaxID=176160 RepID=UPI003CCE488A